MNELEQLARSYESQEVFETQVSEELRVYYSPAEEGKFQMNAPIAKLLDVNNKMSSNYDSLNNKYQESLKEKPKEVVKDDSESKGQSQRPTETETQVNNQGDEITLLKAQLNSYKQQEDQRVTKERELALQVEQLNKNLERSKKESLVTDAFVAAGGDRGDAQFIVPTLVDKVKTMETDGIVQHIMTDSLGNPMLNEAKDPVNLDQYMNGLKDNKSYSKFFAPASMAAGSTPNPTVNPINQGKRTYKQR